MGSSVPLKDYLCALGVPGAILSSVCVIAGWRLLQRRRGRTSNFCTTDGPTCRRILAAEDFSIGQVKIRHLLSKLEARAGPNQRLVEAFEVDISFTTTDDSRCKEFRTRAEEVLVSRTEGWAAWSCTAQVIVRNELEAVEELGRTEIRLVTLVPILTLKIALHVRFKSEPELVHAAYESIAEDINEI